MMLGLILMSHGSIDSLDELPAFLAKIRRGKPAPPDIVAEVRRRHEAIGGSPLNAINRELAKRVEARLGIPVRLANRLSHPSPSDALRELRALGVDEVAMVPLAQHSAAVYASALLSAAHEIGAGDMPIECAPNWGKNRTLVRLFARRIEAALGASSRQGRARTALLMSAHSLPVSVVAAGDRYESDVHASASAIVRELGDGAPLNTVVFQSQGMASPGEPTVDWLGPDLVHGLAHAKASGFDRVLIAPIGFLADHVEILYDIDIEITEYARARNITVTRTESPNADEEMVDVIVDVAEPLLGALASRRRKLVEGELG